MTTINGTPIILKYLILFLWLTLEKSKGLFVKFLPRIEDNISSFANHSIEFKTRIKFF